MQNKPSRRAPRPSGFSISTRSIWIIALAGAAVAGGALFYFQSDRAPTPGDPTAEPTSEAVAVSTPAETVSAMVSSPISLPVSPVQQLDPFSAAYQEGTVFFANNDFQAAVEKYTEAISYNAESASVHNDRGNAYTQLGLYDEALADYNKAIELNPNLPEPYFNRGWIETLQGDFEAALADYELAGNISPLIAYGSTTNRCSIYYQMGEFQQAISECTAAIESESFRAEAYSGRALAYLATEQYEQAIADYEQSISIDRAVPDGYWGLGWANYKAGNYQDAIEATQQAISVTPTDPRLHFNLGLFYLATEETELATNTYDQALTLAESLEADVANKVIAGAVADLEELKATTPTLAAEIDRVIETLSN